MQLRLKQLLKSVFYRSRFYYNSIIPESFFPMISPIKKTPNGKRRLSRVERRAIALEEKAEARIEHIRQNPRLDRYGRPVVDGTPLGSGDKSWRLHYGFAGYESVKTPILGIGIPRDSFLPQECRDNEKNAFRDTPRSSKLTKEIKKWAKKYKFDKDPDFMKNLRMVRKRVQNIKTLKLSKQLESELKPMIFKFASYKLLDKRNPNAHFGSSTRVQMTNATLWNSMGDPGGESACNTTYRPNYTFMDEQRPRTPFGTASREQMTKAQLWAAMGLTGEASTEATYDKNYSLTDERQPAFSFGDASSTPESSPPHIPTDGSAIFKKGDTVIVTKKYSPHPDQVVDQPWSELPAEQDEVLTVENDERHDGSPAKANRVHRHGQ